MTKLLNISVTSNEEEKTFTITKEYSNNSKETYKTLEMSEDEFEEADHNTESDWKNFLNTTNDYYSI